MVVFICSCWSILSFTQSNVRVYFAFLLAHTKPFLMYHCVFFCARARWTRHSHWLAHTNIQYFQEDWQYFCALFSSTRLSLCVFFALSQRKYNAPATTVLHHSAKTFVSFFSFLLALPFCPSFPVATSHSNAFPSSFTHSDFATCIPFLPLATFFSFCLIFILTFFFLPSFLLSLCL